MIKDNKGYMLIEIILASVIAFSVAYLIVDLTVKLKNRNDDMYAGTLVSTDQTIITNKIMEGIIADPEAFKCSDISVEADGKTIKYKDEVIDIMGSSSIISYNPEENCMIDNDGIIIDMPVTVDQLENNYSVHISYRFLSEFTTITPSHPKLGDYVYYKPPTTDYKTLTTYTNISNYQTINPSELELWRVIAINNDGTIDLVSEYVSSTNVSFHGIIGYYNLATYLGILAKQYEDPDYTVRSRYISYDGDYNRIGSVLGTRKATSITGAAKAYWLPSVYNRRYEPSYQEPFYHNYGRIVDSNGNLSVLNFRSSVRGWYDDDYTQSAAIRPIVTLKSGLTFTGKGTFNEPHTIQFGQLIARVDGNYLTAKATASNNTVLLNAVSYEWKVSKNSTCDSSVTDFVRTPGNTYSQIVKDIDYYYVCSRIKYQSGEYGYISKKISQLGQYVTYKSTTTEYKTAMSYTYMPNYETINPSELTLWRILAINDNGTVDLVSEHVSSANVSFYGINGYNSLPSYLGIIAKQYEDPNYTQGSRYLGYPDDYNAINYALGTRRASDNTGTYKTYWLASVYKQRYEPSYQEPYYHNYGRTIDSNGNLNVLNLRSSVTGWYDDDYAQSAALRPVVVLKANFTISGRGTAENPINIQNGQLTASISGSNLTAKVTASDNSLLTNAKTYDFKVSKSSTCDSSVTGFTRTSNNIYTTSVPNINNYYVCAKIGYTSGSYGYISKKVSQLGQYVSYTPISESYTTDSSQTGSSSQTINPSELNLWRILAINDDETVDLVSEHVSSVELSFYGIVGYNNVASYLGVLAKQYEDSNYTKGSRYFSYPDDFNLSNYVLGTRKATNNEGTPKAYWLPSVYRQRIEPSYQEPYNNNNVRIVDTNGNESAYTIRSSVTGYSDDDYAKSASIRPVVVLKSNLNISGDGTSDSPIIIR